MKTTLRQLEIGEPVRSALEELFEGASAYLVNTGPGVARAPQGPEPSAIHAEMRLRWEQQRALDAAVAAVRAGQLDTVTSLVEGPLLRPRFDRGRSLFAQFVGLLIAGGHSTMAGYGQRILLQNPDLAQERFSGRTLLHAAAAAGNLPMVTILLNLGVDPDIQDGSGHTPLYSAGNECAGGAGVVRALVQSGARVDACGGVKRCTALHMAARRGNVEAAEALIECGADIEARDSLGETPLRRAVNCGQTAVAALLLAKGADPLSAGSKGLTPRSAARTREMRSLFESPVR